jgi:hypothetical protein
MIKDGEEAIPQSACVGTPKTILEERTLAERRQAAFEMIVINGLARLRGRNNQKRPARMTVRKPSAESASSVTSFLAVCAD